MRIHFNDELIEEKNNALKKNLQRQGKLRQIIADAPELKELKELEAKANELIRDMRALFNTN